MNTFNLGKPLETFGLRTSIINIVVDTWKEIIQFTLYMKRLVSFNLDR